VAVHLFCCSADTVEQLQASGFGEWFAFDPHFYVMDCRLSRDSEIDRLKSKLIEQHAALSLRPGQVSRVCAILLEKLEGLRQQHKKDPIITVKKLLKAAPMYSEASLALVCDSICR
jgi:hypothetical protein